MKIKRLISFIVAILLMCTSAAFAVAVRINPIFVVELPSREKPNDVIFEDFSRTEEGGTPAIFKSVSTDNGYTSSATYDIGGGVEKVCFELVDTDHSEAYNGPTTDLLIPRQAGGLVSFEMRYKYVDKSAQSDTCSMTVVFYDDTNKTLETLAITSKTGNHDVNHGNATKERLEYTKMKTDTWYTLKYLFDFENHKLDVSLLNEGTGVLTQAFDKPFNAKIESDNLARIRLKMQVYGGAYVFDYVRLSREEERMAPEDDSGKGCPAQYIKKPVSHAVDGKINIKLDGKFKYTTKNPKIDGENVLVTAKNIASIFNLNYFMTVSGAVIKSEDVVLTIATDGSGIKNNGSDMNLSASCISEDKQVFVPIKDVVEALGYNCRFDAETNTVLITTPVEEEGE